MDCRLLVIWLQMNSEIYLVGSISIYSLISIAQDSAYVYIFLLKGQGMSWKLVISLSKSVRLVASGFLRTKLTP